MDSTSFNDAHDCEDDEDSEDDKKDDKKDEKRDDKNDNGGMNMTQTICGSFRQRILPWMYF